MNVLKRATNALVRGVLAALLASTAGADLTADQTPFDAYRGLWVDRFDYSVPNATSSIRTIMTNAKALGITDVMFQVRGQADAYYWNNNNLEVKASGVTSTNDPLAIALTEGHARGIKVHAWINAMPLWNARELTGGAYTPTAPASHLINTNPEFRIRDKNNNPLPFPTGGTGYTIVNPARNDVQTHINNVVGAITTNYAVDGLHLDYIRLYSSNPGSTNVLEYPGDVLTVSLFQQQFPGQTPESHPANFKAFMAGRITDLVRSIRETTKANRPHAQVTAAVWRDADIGLDEYQQDWARWADEGLLDAAMPMIYRKGFGDGSIAGTNADPGDLYRLNVTEGLNRRATAGVMVGLGNYMQNDAATAYGNIWNQLTYAKAQGANGVQLFDYGTLFNGSAASNEAKRAFADFFAANSGAPAITNLANFEIGEGPFKWAITASGSNRNVMASSSAEPVGGGANGSNGAQRIVINKAPGAASFIARHLSGTDMAAEFGSNTPFASIGTLGVWLKTTTSDLQVSLAVDDTATGDRGYLQNVIADGQWHKYEWSLADPTHWDAWVGGSNGHLSTITALDSIQFFGTADTSTIFMDEVFYNAGAVAPNQWTFDANGTWNNSGHWTGGVPNGVGSTANLLRRGTGNRTVTLDAPVTVGTLTFDNASSYTVAGSNTLSLDVTSGSAAINVVNRGTHTMAAPVAVRDSTGIFVDRGSRLVMSGALNNSTGKVIVKTGDGELEISGVQTHGSGAAFNLAGGLTRFRSNVGGNASINLANGAAEFAVGQTMNDLVLNPQTRATLAGGKRVLAVKSLSINGGVLDLSDGALVQDYGNGGASPLGATREKIRGGEITSSGLGATTGLGYGEASTVLGIDGGETGLFMGQSVDASSVLVRLTLLGDADLDGVVNFEDLVAVAQNYGLADGSGVWTGGDFDHDGNVGFSDLVALAQNYNGTVPTGALTAGFAAEVREAFATVPEPSVIAIGMSALMMGRRRRAGAFANSAR